MAATRSMPQPGPRHWPPCLTLARAGTRIRCQPSCGGWSMQTTWRRWDACWRWAWIRIWSNRQSLLVSPRCSGPPAGNMWRRLMHCWRLVPGSTEPIATAAPRWITRTTVAALQFWSASRSTKVRHRHRHRHRRLRRRQAQANAEPQPRGCRTKGPPCIHNTAGPADVGTDAHRLEPKPLRTAPTCTSFCLLVCCLAGFLLFFS